MLTNVKATKNISKGEGCLIRPTDFIRYDFISFGCFPTPFFVTNSSASFFPEPVFKLRFCPFRSLPIRIFRYENLLVRDSSDAD